MHPSPSRGTRARLRHAAPGAGAAVLAAVLLTGAAPGGTHTVRGGETAWGIADRYGVGVGTLVAANGLRHGGRIVHPGQRLRVPGARGTAVRTGGPRARRAVLRHRVVPGDTLIGIARRYGVTTGAIARANALPRFRVVRLGEVLRVPGGRSTTARRAGARRDNTFAGRTYSDRVVAAAAATRALLARSEQPSRRQVRDLIVRTARRRGVDPALALAVSRQESGWNMRVVSVAGAVGAMQVLPATARWMSGVVGRRLDERVAEDNVVAGVTLLRVLRSQAGEREAIAGYYQGLAGVRRVGMYPDTRRYVANVLALKRRYAGS